METQYENVDMIPCDAQTPRINKRIELLIGDAERLKDGDPRKVSGMGDFLYYFLNQVRDEYDYILIDTQPTRDSLLLSNAIYAADYILIPAGCEDNSEESAFHLQTHFQLFVGFHIGFCHRLRFCHIAHRQKAGNGCFHRLACGNCNAEQRCTELFLKMLLNLLVCCCAFVYIHQQYTGTHQVK